MEQLIDEILREESVRKQLSDLRKQLKEHPENKHLCGDSGMILRLVQLLKSPDAKTRKNAALLLGDLGEAITESGESEMVMEALWDAFCAEETKFVKSSYIYGLGAYPAESYVQRLHHTLWDMNQSEIPEEDLKHTRELRREIENVLENWGERTSVSFQGIHRKHAIFLVAEPYIQDNLRREIKKLCNLESVATKRGVRVLTDSLKKIEEIRYFRDLWFVLRVKEGVVLDQVNLPEKIAKSELMPILKEVYGEEKSYTFKLSYMGPKEMAERLPLKQLSFQLEEASNHTLVNSSVNPQVEIKICPKKEGTFSLYGKFLGCPKARFAYHRESLPTSMTPVTAAQMVELVSPYLLENAHVLDPFCGQGNLLIERYRKLPARDVYGVDIYGQAIESARKQTETFGREFYYINRNFFDFTTSYLMDEIITECPRMENKSHQEVDEFYEKFFKKAIEVTTDQAFIFVLSTEENAIKKQVRLHDKLQLVRQIAMRGAENIYILKRRG